MFLVPSLYIVLYFPSLPNFSVESMGKEREGGVVKS